MFAWTPFGAGRHRCVGAPLALLVMKIVLGRLITTYDMWLVDPDVGVDSTTMISPPKSPCRLRYGRRA